MQTGEDGLQSERALVGPDVADTVDMSTIETIEASQPGAVMRHSEDIGYTAPSRRSCQALEICSRRLVVRALNASTFSLWRPALLLWSRPALSCFRSRISMNTDILCSKK